MEIAPDSLESGGADVFMELLEDASGQEAEVTGLLNLPADGFFDGFAETGYV